MSGLFCKYAQLPGSRAGLHRKSQAPLAGHLLCAGHVVGMVSRETTLCTYYALVITQTLTWRGSHPA